MAIVIILSVVNIDIKANAQNKTEHIIDLQGDKLCSMFPGFLIIHYDISNRTCIW